LETLCRSGWFSRDPLRRGNTLQHYAAFLETDSSECRKFGDKTGIIKIWRLDIEELPHSRSKFLVIIKPLRIGFIALILFVASAWGAGSVLEGTVKDAKGHPIEGAAIRIETKNGARLFTTVKTDVHGRYVLEGLPAGNYRITLVVNGAVKTSINNTKLELGEPTQLNFDLTSTSAWRALPAAQKGTHWVWLPPFTGSRLPGRWIEVDDKGSWAAAHASNEDVIRISGEELQRTAHSVSEKKGR
jgi:hypothetical protein